jgi:outer membrane protein assembly factor BamD (BamD/ComL family)
MDKDVRMQLTRVERHALDGMPGRARRICPSILRAAVVLAVLVVALPGCQAFQSSPPPQSDPKTPDEAYQDWLTHKLAAEDQPAAAPQQQTQGAPQQGMPQQPGSPPAATPASPYPVQQTSANQAAQSPAASEQNVETLGASVTSAAGAGAKEKVKKCDEDEDPGFDWSDLDPGNVWKKMKVAMGKGPDETIAQSLYREGESLYQQKSYHDAALKFAAAADRWPDSPLEEDALFFQGESHFFADEYPKADDTFLMLFKKYSNSRYLDVAVRRQFAIARYWEQQHVAHPHWPVTPNFRDKTQPIFDTKGNAINAYQSVRLNDPTGPLADDAVMAIAVAHFLDGEYADAAYHFDVLRKEYPKSEHQVQAHILDLESKRRMYQGPFYDGTPLIDGDEIAKQALTQFPKQLGDERSRIIEARSQMMEQRAERDWAIAKFYEKKKAYGAAKDYYRMLIRDHPGSKAAEAAEQRLVQIKDYPDEPPNYFKWVDKILPSTRSW